MVGKETEKLKKEADELRAQLEDPEITEEERVILRRLIDETEGLFLHLTEVANDFLTGATRNIRKPLWVKIVFIPLYSLWMGWCYLRGHEITIKDKRRGTAWVLK